MGAPAGGEIRSHLQRILASPEFARSARLSTLLRLLVERSLEGRSGELKEIAIASELRRNPAYDPAVDSAVRVEARRLREKLAAYYANSGSSEPLRIQIPKGRYAPVFVAAPPRSRRPQILRAAAALFVLFLIAGAGYAANQWWRSRQTSQLLAQAAAITPARTDFHLQTQAQREQKYPLDRLMTAAALLERATLITPGRVEVYTALARTYWFAGDYDRALYLRSGDTATRALALGLQNADLHFYRGYAHFFASRNFGAAFESFHRATELNPRDDRTYRYAMDAAWLAGRIAEAAPLVARARQYHPQSDMLDFAEVGYRIRMGDPARAMAVAESFVRRRPNQAAAHRVYGGVLARFGRYKESLREYAEALRLSPGDRPALSALGYVQAKSGDVKAARQTLALLKNASPYHRIPTLLGLDEREALLEALAAAKAEDDHGYIYFAGDSRFSHLLSDPRFAAILPRI